MAWRLHVATWNFCRVNRLFDDDECFGTPRLEAALLDASDHSPVSVDLATGLVGLVDSVALAALAALAVVLAASAVDSVSAKPLTAFRAGTSPIRGARANYG